VTIEETLNHALDELEDVGETLVTIKFEADAFCAFQWRDTPLRLKKKRAAVFHKPS
jgi:hypothetical protein